MFFTYIEYDGCFLNQASIVAAEHHPFMRIDRSRKEVVSQACRMATSSLAMKGCRASCSRTIRSQCDTSCPCATSESYSVAQCCARVVYFPQFGISIGGGCCCHSVSPSKEKTCREFITHNFDIVDARVPLRRNGHRRHVVIFPHFIGLDAPLERGPFYVVRMQKVGYSVFVFRDVSL